MASNHSPVAVESCPEFFSTSRADRISYVEKGEPSEPVETAIQVADWLYESCRLLKYDLKLDHAVLDNAVVHVTGRMPGEPRLVSPSKPLAGSTTGGGVLGSTDAEWNAAHQIDRKYETGAVYDPVEGLAEGMTDRFSSVIHSSGHVTDFYFALPSKASIAQAVAAVMVVVPQDATHGPVAVHSECASMTIHSATLQTTLGSPNAEAFFGNTTSYNPDEVGGAEIVGNPPPSETGC